MEGQVKHAFGVLAIAAILALGVGGCAQLTEAQRARIEQLAEKNETLSGELGALYTQARQGLADPAEIVAAIKKVNDAMAENHAEIKRIQGEGTTTLGIIAATAGMFGRTLLHAATKLPIPGPVGMILQMGLGLLLGGSETRKKDDTVAQAKAQ